jgi:Fic family protein
MPDSTIFYSITDKTLMSIASIERNLAIINQSEITPKARNRILNEGLFDDLFAFNNYFNLGLTLGDIKKVSIGKDVIKIEAKLLANVRQVFDFMKNNFRDRSFAFNFHLIQHVVKLLQSNILEVWDIGKIRSGGETLDNRFELDGQNYAKSDATNSLAEAILWVENENDIHPIIKAISFMMWINATSPFVGLNHVASIVFLRTILEKYGYSSLFNIPLFKFLNIKPTELRNKIEKTLVKNNGVTDVLEFTLNLLDELVVQYKNDLVKFDYFDMKANNDKIDLNERQVRLLKLLQQKTFIRRYQYVKLFKVSPMTAYRDLNFLTEKKLLNISGSGKATTYTLSTY